MFRFADSEIVGSDLFGGVGGGSSGRGPKASGGQSGGPEDDSGSLAGDSSSSGEGTDAPLRRHGIEFDRTNEVTPGETIEDREGTLNLLQPGTHVLHEHKRVVGSGRVGIVGAGDPGDVVLKPAVDTWTYPWVFRGDRDVLIGNFTLNQRDDRRSGIGLKAMVGDGLRVHDLRVRGTMTDEAHCATPGRLNNAAIALGVTDPDGSGVYADCDYRVHAPVEDYPTGTVAHYAGPSHRGTLRVERATVVGSAMHSWYASRSNGEVHVRGGLFKNNSNTNLRLSRDSTIKNATIVIDAPPSKFVAPNGEAQNVRGIRWERAKWNGSSGGVIEDCRLVCRSPVHGQGLVAVDGSCGELTIRDCEFVNTTEDYRNIVVEEVGSNPRDIEPPEEDWVRVKGCSLSGGGGRPLVTDQRGSADVS